MPDRFGIVAFGSSSTEGVGATTPDRTYPARLSALFAVRTPRARVDVLNRGIGGDHILDMLTRLERDVIAAGPGLVIWQVGTNDPLRGVGLEAFARALDRGAAAIAAGGADLALMEPQWCPVLAEADPDGGFVRAVRAAADRLGVPNIRRHALMEGWFATGRVAPGDVIGPDGLHMTDEGYRLLAEAAYEAITRGSPSLIGHLARCRAAR